MKMKVRGLRRTQHNLLRFKARMIEGAGRANRAAGERILTRAQQLVPVDTGHLRDSGYVRESNDSVEVGFDADYALHVHERTDIFHQNGQAKFLETAVNELAPTITETYAQHIFRRVT